MKHIATITAAALAIVACGPASKTPRDESDNMINLGYEKIAPSDNTYSIDHKMIRVEDVSQYSDILEYLRGRCPGVDIGMPVGGGMPSVVIRGKNSLTGSNQALFVVDGAIMEDIMGISPLDIYSVDVLKDGASAAMYGSQGANGVIVITTRNGHERALEAAAARKEARKAKKEQK